MKVQGQDFIAWQWCGKEAGGRFYGEILRSALAPSVKRAPLETLKATSLRVVTKAGQANR